MNDRDLDQFRHEQQAPPRQGRGCLFWGCLTVGVLFLLLVIGVPLAGYLTFRHYVNKYTSAEPMEIAVVELPEEQLAELKTRFEAFEEALKAGDTPGDLELTAEELNALIASNEDLQGRVLVRVQDGRVGGDVSIPTDEFPGGGGRYFNASADFDVSMEDGNLIVTLASADVNGSPLPKTFLDAVANQNLAQELYKDAESAAVLRKFESLEITGDRILLKAKQPAAGAAQGADEAPAEAPPAETDADTPGDAGVESQVEEPVGAG